MGSSNNQVFLIWGGNSWIRGNLLELLEKDGHIVYTTATRMENREDVTRELINVKPTHLFNGAGVIGRPNVDWCEDNKEATVRANVIGTLNLPTAALSLAFTAPCMQQDVS
jgi:3,5-epimerase/4-reductase